VDARVRERLIASFQTAGADEEQPRGLAPPYFGSDGRGLVAIRASYDVTHRSWSLPLCGEAAATYYRSFSSIPQARRRLRGVPALPAEQKNRY